MPEFTLEPQSAFTTQPSSYEDIRIEAIETRAIVSIACPNGGADALAGAIQSAYGVVGQPRVGTSVSGSEGTMLMRLAQDQMFALFDYPQTGSPVATVRVALMDTAFLTDQSDSWAILRINGARSQAALERICPLDLDDARFPTGSVARTVMEHLAVIIHCEAPDAYLLLSPRSSADDFLHAVETSARNVT